MTGGVGEKSRYRVEALDGLRAFALVGVVVFHLFGISGVLTAGGDSLHERAIWAIFGNTLDIFFILSGFVLFLPVVRRGGEVGRVSDWYLKRFGRLQPEYWACLLVLVAMIALVPVDFQPAVPTFGNFVIHFFDLQTVSRMFDPATEVGFFIDAALWLVPVIAGLYLIFPWVAKPFFRHVWVGLTIAAVVTTAWKLAPVHFPGAFQSISGNVIPDESVAIIAFDQTPAYVFSFALGMAAAWIFFQAKSKPESPWIKRGVLAAFVIGIPAYFLVSIPFTEAALSTTTGFDGSSRGRGLAFNQLLSSVVRTCLILGIILGPVWLQRPLANRAVSWVADQSYGIYLIHLPIAFYAIQLLSLPQAGGIKALVEWGVVVLPIATVYAWCSRQLVGKPSVRLVDNWIRHRRQRAAQQ